MNEFRNHHFVNADEIISSCKKYQLVKIPEGERLKRNSTIAGCPNMHSAEYLLTVRGKVHLLKKEHI